MHCTHDFWMRFLRDFPRIDKRGVGIKVGGLENVSKIDKRGDDYSVLESTNLGDFWNPKIYSLLNGTLKVEIF